MSNKWTVIEYDDTSPQSLVITLNAKDGRFITKGDKIQKWDRIFVATVEDVFWVNTIKKSRQKGRGLLLKLFCPHQSSNLVKQTISKPNRRSSGKVAMDDVFAQMNSNVGTLDPTIDNPSSFNQVTKIGVNLDDTTSNDYIFESVKAIDAINEIIEREGNPVEVGGSFEFHLFRFKSKYNHGTGMDLNVVQPQVFQQGFIDNSGTFNNIPKVTLIKPTLASGNRANTLELDTSLEIEKGTNLIGLGQKGSGSYKGEYARFLGAKTVFESALAWVTATDYVVGALVRFAPVSTTFTYECILDHTSNAGNNPDTGLGTTWVLRTFTIPATWVTSVAYIKTDILEHNNIAYKVLVNHTSDSTNEPPNTAFWVREAFPPTKDYSPLTKDKAQYWINAMGGPKHAATNNAQTAMIDPSVIVKDELHPRTWVDAVEDDSVVLLLKTDLMQNGLPFDGFRVLVVDPTTGSGATGSGDFSGSDANGVSFAGNIAEWQDPELTNPSTTGAWVVIKETQNFDDQEVYDFEEGRSWTNNSCEPTFTLGIADRHVDDDGACKFVIGGAPASRNTVWKKGAYRLSEYITGKFGVWFVDSQFECVHSVKWDSGNSRIDAGNEQLGQPNTNALFTELGSTTSAVFVKSEPTDVTRTFPYFVGLNFAFPWPRTANSTPFGAVVIGEQIDLPTFDLDNLHLTHTRIRQWFGPEVEDYFPIQSFSFLEFLREQAILDIFTGANGPKREADYSMAVWLADRSDTVIIIEYTHSHNNNAFPQEGPISKQRIFRAVPGTSVFIPAQAPEILDVFDFRNVIRGGIYTKDSFDEQNRYKGLRSRFVGSNEIKLSVDAFRMSKPLVVTNQDEPNNDELRERNIEPLKFQWEKISNYAQLKNYILAQTRISGFRVDRYPVITPGRCQVAFGDPVYYEDPEAIDETTDALPNTVKAVNFGALYTLSKGADGPGGFMRHFNLITRLWPEELP